MKGLSDMFNNFRFKVLFWFLSLLKLTVYNLPTHYIFFMYLSRFYRLCFKKFIMPGRNHFKDKWLDCTDNNGDKAGAKSSLSKESGLKVMKLSMENIKELRKDLDRKQDNLSKLMGKKPKNI